MTWFLFPFLFLSLVNANKYLYSEFQQIIRQKSYGNKVSQCPCVIHPESRQCISYDSRYLASNIEEAILAFIDLSNKEYRTQVVNPTTFQCSSAQCQQCFGTLFYRLLDIGLVPNGYRPTTRLLSRSQITPSACPKFKFTTPSFAAIPPAVVPNYIQSTIAAGQSYQQRQQAQSAASGSSLSASGRGHQNSNTINSPVPNTRNTNGQQSPNNGGAIPIPRTNQPRPRQPRPNQPGTRPGPRPRPRLFRPRPPPRQWQRPQPRPRPQPTSRQWQQQQPRWNQQQQSRWNNNQNRGNWHNNGWSSAGTGIGLGTSLGASLGSLSNLLGNILGTATGGASGNGQTESSTHTIIIGKRHKRQAEENIIGVRYTIGCTGKGVVEGNSMALCGTCWTWRQLPADYFPRLVNELSCQENDFCLSGWGQCVQQYRNTDVLKKVGGRWVPTVISTGSCCDCRVRPGTQIHSLVVGDRKA